jgi:hypothetical protein
LRDSPWLLGAVASQAFRVVKGGIALRLLMGVMTGQATDAAIARIEAKAFGQAVRLEADGYDSLCLNCFHVRSGPVAGAAKPDQVSGCQGSRVENPGIP